MRNLMNSDQSYTGLVQKYIGSAYDVVHAVYLALEGLKKVEGIIGTPEWEEIVKLAPDFEEFMHKLRTFYNGFYGALGVEPTGRPDGTPSRNGDLYYDKVRMGLFMFEDGHWERVGATSNQLEVIKVGKQHLQGQVARIKLQHGFQPGANSIMVFVNATYQYAVSPSTPDGAYVESRDGHTLEFPLNPHVTQGNLEEGDVVTVLTGGVVTNVEHQFSVDIEKHQVNLVQQKVFTVDMSYLPGVHNLEVYVDGARQVLGVEYFETDQDTVTFKDPLQHGQMVVFKRGHVIGNTAGSGNANDVVILNTAGEFYLRRSGFREDTVVMLLGYHGLADGGGGTFTYDPLMPKAFANGGTVIDSSRPLDEQGQGNGNGVWVRQYSNTIQFHWFGAGENLVKNLTKIPLASRGDVVYVNGFHKEGDGGEGYFHWDPDVPKANHDGGIVIDPHKEYPKAWGAPNEMHKWFTPTAGTNGCWVRQDQDDANLYWWGMSGDGQTDNSDIFEGIARAMSNQVLHHLRVPTGTFLLNGLYAMHLANMNGIEIYGSGKDCCLEFGPNANNQPLLFNLSKNIYVHGIHFKDSRAGIANAYLLEFTECNNITVERCWFSDTAATAVAFRGDKSASNPIGLDHIQVTNCVFEDNTNAFGQCIVFAPAAMSNELHISNNSFYRCGTSHRHPSIIAGVACHDAVINNNFFKDCEYIGIQIMGWEEVQVSENHFTDHKGDCIEISCMSHPAYKGASLNHALIRDNVMEEVGGFGVTLNGNHSINGMVDISDNHLVVTNGISIRPASGTQLEGVIVRNNQLSPSPAIAADLTLQMITLLDVNAPLVLNNVLAPGINNHLLVTADPAGSARVTGNLYRDDSGTPTWKDLTGVVT